MSQIIDASTRFKKPPLCFHKSFFVGLIHALCAIVILSWIIDPQKIEFPVILQDIVSPVMQVIQWIRESVIVTLPSIVLAIGYFVVSSTGITAGYHRFFSHKSYEANTLVQLFHLIAGAAAFQGSARQWSAQHRAHHADVDGPDDPYNINLGFWFAHIGWVLRKTNPKYNKVKDLDKNPLVMWQFRWYYPLAFGTTFVLPLLLGMFWNEALGACFMVGIVRLLIQWHMTFCVNSVAHYWGDQKYSTKHTARGNWWLAWITWGEMDHNFHHTFASDFRTGTRWYDFDPGKWFVYILKALGWAWNIKVTDDATIARQIEKAQQNT